MVNLTVYADGFFFFVLAFNVIGNSLVIYIISKKQRTATDYLLLNLAIADMTYGVFLVPTFLPQTIKHSEIFQDKFLCKLLWKGNISSTAKYACIGTMMILSLERYFAVCRPHSFKKWFCIRNAKVAMVVIWVFSVIYTLPYYISYDKGCGMKESVSKVTSVLSITLAGCEMVFLITLSMKIYIALWLNQTAIHPTAHREIEEIKKKKKVTLCVLAVILSFLLAYIPHFVVYVAMHYDAVGEDALGQVAIKITSVLLTINAALDPYLYSFQNSRFRGILRKMFFCRSNSEQQLPAAQQVAA